MNPSLVDRMMRAARLDATLYEEVEADPTAMGQAMTVVVLSAVAAGIGGIRHGGLSGLLIGLLAALVGWFLWAGIIYLVGTKMMPEPQTDADMGQLLRTIGFASSPGIIRVVGFVPVLGWLIGLAASIWMLVATVVAVRQALDYTTTGKAVLVCVIGFVVYLVLSVFVGMFFGGAAMIGGAMAG